MFYTERITIYKEKNPTIMQTIIKTIAGIILIGGLIILISMGLNSLQKPNALDNIEKRLDETEEKQKVLTEKEKELVQDALTKEWEEVDKQIDK